MRLIDADALADALLDQRKKYPQWVADIIGNMPDTVVRCKNCKYCGSEIRDGIKFAKCELKHNWMPQPEWFCADGEQREYVKSPTE